MRAGQGVLTCRFDALVPLRLRSAVARRFDRFAYGEKPLPFDGRDAA
jgi:hypothetical protein